MGDKLFCREAYVDVMRCLLTWATWDRALRLSWTAQLHLTKYLFMGPKPSWLKSSQKLRPWERDTLSRTVGFKSMSSDTSLPVHGFSRRWNSSSVSLTSAMAGKCLAARTHGHLGFCSFTSVGPKEISILRQREKRFDRFLAAEARS